MAHRLKDQASRARRSRAPRSAPSKAFFSRGCRGSEESAQPDAIGHKNAYPLGYKRFVTCIDLRTPGGTGIKIILGVYIKALCRHPLRPFRAEGVPLHDAEGRAHNGVYEKDSRHGRREAATGYHLCL